MADFSYESIKQSVSDGISRAADTVSNVASDALDTLKGTANSLISTLLSDVKQPSAEGLSHHLIADFFAVEEQIGKDLNGDITTFSFIKPSTPIVRAFVIEADFSVDLNWQSPFESAGPETKAPALSGLLQSGQLESAIGNLKNIIDFASSKNAEDKETNMSDSVIQSFSGRTGISKLNSRQTFNGMPPYKIQATLLFRAWMDARKEVEALFDQMMTWALPQELANDATVIAMVNNSTKKEKTMAETLLPSKIPQLIGMRYKGRTFMPLVIESIGQPLSSPINSRGEFVQLQVPITLCSIAAIDKNDWKKLKRGVPMKP